MVFFVMLEKSPHWKSPQEKSCQISPVEKTPQLVLQPVAKSPHPILGPVEKKTQFLKNSIRDARTPQPQEIFLIP